MRYIFMLIWIAILIVGIAFASLNAHEVEVNIFVMKVHVFLPLVILTAMVLGAFCGLLASLPNSLKSKYNNRKLRKRVQKLEREITDMQNNNSLQPQG